MICPKCGMQLPEDSDFCQYCGANVQIADQREAATEDTPSLGQSPEVASLSSHVPSDASSVKKKETRKTVLGKVANTTKLIPVLLLMVLLLLAGLNVYQFVANQHNAKIIADLSDTISGMNSQIEDLNADLSREETELEESKSKVTEKDAQIKKKNSEISSLENRISLLEDDAEKYESIVDAIKYGDLGYAASNFQASESIIVVGQNEKNRKFTLTAHWSNGGNVSVDYDTYLPSAYVEFDLNSWTTSTKMTIEPMHSGVTVVTFSNDVNNQEFNVIIVVE